MKMFDRLNLSVIEKPMEFKYTQGIFKKYHPKNTTTSINIRYMFHSNQTDSEVVVTYSKERRIERMFVGMLGLVVPGLELAYLLAIVPGVYGVVVGVMIYDVFREMHTSYGRAMSALLAVVYVAADLAKETHTDFFLRVNIIIIFILFMIHKTTNSIITLLLMIFAITMQKEFG